MLFPINTKLPPSLGEFSLSEWIVLASIDAQEVEQYVVGDLTPAAH
jgi:hypothetical protein